MPKVSVRTHVFVFIFMLVTAIIILFSAMQFYFSKEAALKATQQSFHLSASNIASDLNARSELAKEILYQMQNYSDITADSEKDLDLKLFKRYVYTLKRTEAIRKIYSANANDDFFEVVKLENSADLQGYFDAPKGSAWLAIIVTTKAQKREKRLYFFNNKLQLMTERKEPSDYYPTQRPWYILAKGRDGALRTRPYLFKALHEQGMTYVKRIDNSQTVLALDLSLARIDKILRKFHFGKSSAVTLFGDDGGIISSSRSRNEVDIATIERFLKNPIMHYMGSSSDGKRYIMITRVNNNGSYQSYLSISIDKSELLAPYINNIIYSMLAAFALLLLSIPMALIATNIILKPIRSLMAENSKIRNRQFDKIKPISTKIIELDRLSHSLVDMAKSIEAYQVAQKELMDSFIKLIAEAIDAKSPYTGGHCRRVPLIAIKLIKEASHSQKEAFKAFSFNTKEELEEFERGAWLHDCGKITTPEYVVDKATKLETVYNRIHEVRMRFEVLWRDISIAALERQLAGESVETLEQWRQVQQQKLRDDFSFVAESNIGGEYMSEAKKRRIQAISEQTWTRYFDNRLGLSTDELLRYDEKECRVLPVEERLLSDRKEHIIPRIDFDAGGYAREGFKLEVPEYLYNYGEVYNLCIERGTLSKEERFKIQEHVIMSIKMLEQLPFTEDMQRIPEYAGTHHETLIGTGYPRALHKAELSIPARVMAIADIFEALTASDRPYKKGKKLSQALKIMSFMVKDQHIDAELFRLFLESGIYMEYAQVHLKEAQVDEVDIRDYL